MSAIILKNDIVHYEVLGRGRPVVFLHGWVGSWRYWITAMQAAAIQYRAYALDLWGFGDTAKRSEYYALDEQMELLDGFLDKLGVGRIALVGHGLGAVVALKYAARHAGYVNRVMGIGLPVGDVTINQRLRNDSPAVLADWLLSDDPVSEAVRVEAPKTDPLAVRTSLDELNPLTMLDLARELSTPCLLVHGQRDPAVSLNNAALDPYELPENTHQILFAASGHFPMLEEASKFNRLMNDFLGLASGESPRQLQLKEEWKRRVR